MKRVFRNKKTKNIVLIVLSCVLLFGAIFGIMALFNKEESTIKEISPTYGLFMSALGRAVNYPIAIKVSKGDVITLTTTSLENKELSIAVYQYLANGDLSSVEVSYTTQDVVISAGVEFVRVVFKNGNGTTSFSDTALNQLNSCIAIN